MDKITICDLEVFYHVGVTAEERAQPQRLLLTLEVAHDFSAAQASARLADTIDYAAITQRLLHFGRGRQWELIETLAGDIATLILDEFKPRAVAVEVKKFILPQTRYVSVSLTRKSP
jgi:7,8-dihydroneopterin aldolase/epimerase/oxygenase